MKYRLSNLVRNPGGGTAFRDDLAIRARRDARPGVSGSGPSTGGGSSSSAAPLWLHFQNVISWVRMVFPHYRSKMKEAAYAKQGGNCARCGKHFPLAFLPNSRNIFCLL